MPYNTRTEKFETFKLMRKERWEYMIAMIISRLKYLFIIFTIFITGTGVFYNDHSKYSYRYLLYIAWFSVFFGLVFLLAHTHLTIKWIIEMMLYEEKFFIHDDQNAKQPSEKYNSFMRIIPILTDIFFMFGILFFILFVIFKQCI